MIVATFSIRFARSAKRSAESVSSALSIAGEALHSITVTELPPSESCSSRVSFESRSVAARAKVVNRKSVSTVRKEGAGRLEGGGAAFRVPAFELQHGEMYRARGRASSQ